MDIEQFLNYKNNPENKIMNMDNIFNYDKNIKYNKKRNRYNKRKMNNLLKNNNLQQQKKKIENKINLILNKLSLKNRDNIIIEFIKNIELTNSKDYNIFLKTLYIKILNEIQFIDIYILFYEIISNIYEKKFNYNSEYFINIIEEKINNDYLNISLNQEWLNKYTNENYRKNNLEIIKKLIKNKLLNNKMEILVNSIILNQNKYLSDIYYWFINLNISDNNKLKIKSILKNNISFREKTLINNLFENNKNIIKPIIQKNYLQKNIIKPIIKPIIQEDNNNRFIIECENIYEEYNYLGLIDEIICFINDNCKTANVKNLFCKIGIEFYLKNNDNKIITLFDKLIDKKYLYKSNLSRGLSYLIKNNYKYNDKKMIFFLTFLKNKGITKNIEFLIKKHNID